MARSDSRSPDRDYYERIRAWLEDSYLAADARGDVFGGSGCGAKDMAHWRARRDAIADAFDRDGTWLDVGCANGLLMKTLAAWVAERGHRIAPYGLELSARVAEAARRRLPHWADRIWAGNVMEFEPLMRFDYVTALADAVPPGCQSELIRRLARVYLKPTGRLVLSCYTPGAFIAGTAARDVESPAAMLREAGLKPASESVACDPLTGIVKTRVAWADVVIGRG
jgi:SAM-dependent methyltransferase